MAEITYIPDRYKDGFKKMASLEKEVFANIEEGLSYTSLTLTISSLAEKVAKLKNLDTSEVKEIFLSAGSLIPFLDKKIEVKEIVKDIAVLALENKIVDPENIETLKLRLTTLLNNEQVYYASKSSVVLTEHGNVFIQARVLTDIRPIFSINVQETPKAGMIIHNLHIHYQGDQEGDHKDLFLALDSKDIKSLKDSLIRAEQKESALQKLYDKIGMANLNE